MYLHRIRKQQLRSINAQGLYPVIELENRCALVLADMEYAGVGFDTKAWGKIFEKSRLRQAEIFKELDGYLHNEEVFKDFIVTENDGYETLRYADVSWTSPMQKLAVLRKIIPTLESTDKRYLSKFKKAHPIIPLLLELTKICKLKSSYGSNFNKYINSTTGRIHPSYWQILETGRMSCKEPNLQQIPSRDMEWAPLFRRSFIPKEGNVMVGCDYSQFELRILAELSGEEYWINIFKDESRDLHSELAALTFNIPLADVRKPSPYGGIPYRNIQKTVNFGLSYGMSAFKLADTIECEVHEAEAIIEMFYENVPKVKDFLTAIGNYGAKKGYIRAAQPYSFKRVFPEWNQHMPFSAKNRIIRQSKNMVMQSTNAMLLKLALVYCYERIQREDLPVQLLMPVHDEIVSECPKDIAEYWATALSQEMSRAARKVLKKVPAKAEAAIGNNWNQVH